MRSTRVFKVLRILVVLGVVTIGALVAFLSIEKRTEVALPEPTGPYAVGRSIYDWRDDKTVDALAPVAGRKRELLVWIWYPATPKAGSVVDDYVPAALRAAARTRGPLILRPLTWLFNLLSHDISKVYGHSLRDADVQEGSHPVVIMRAGASTPVWNYSTLAEDLASHGYVVVGFDTPYRTIEVVFPDGRVVERLPENDPELYEGEELKRVGAKLIAAWTSDIGFVLDRLADLDTEGKFAGRIDLTRVGVFGHSFGGATAAQFCSQDWRCKAGVDVDGAPFGSVIRTGMRKPFMFLLSGEGDFSSDVETRQIMGDIQSIYDRLPAETRMRLMIRGANHFTFSDDGAVLKSRVARGMLRWFGKLGIDGSRQLAITGYCLRSFFDAYVKGEGRSRVRIDTGAYPELEVLST